MKNCDEKCVDCWEYDDCPIRQSKSVSMLILYLFTIMGAVTIALGCFIPYLLK